METTKTKTKDDSGIIRINNRNNISHIIFFILVEFSFSTLRFPGGFRVYDPCVVRERTHNSNNRRNAPNIHTNHHHQDYYYD